MFFGPPSSGSTTTPQKTLHAFISAFNRRDRRMLEALVYNSKNNPKLDGAFKGEKEKPTVFSLSKVIKVKQVSSTRVVVQYILDAKLWGKMPMDPFHEQIEMVKVGRNWLIAAPNQDVKSVPGNLASIAMIVAYPEFLERTQMAIMADDALTRLKLMSNAAWQHRNDNNDKILLKPEDYVKVLSPLVKNIRVFTSPLDKPGTISFLLNGNMTDQDTSVMKKPESMVLFFEGKPGELNFRYNGRALVAFCDGSVKFVTPAQAKSLLWMPETR